MPIAPKCVPTAKSADATASRHRVAPLPRNWPRSSNPARQAMAPDAGCPSPVVEIDRRTTLLKQASPPEAAYSPAQGPRPAACGSLHTCEVESHRALPYSPPFQLLTNGSRLALTGRMKLVWLGCLVAASTLFAGSQDSEFNVNTRFTVETVVINADGWTTNLAADHDHDGKLSPALRKDVSALIGEKLNPTMLDEIGRRLRKEFHARTVEHRVLRGKSPDYVQVAFDVKLKPARFDVSVPKFLYNSKQGWSGAVEGTATIGHNGFTAGLVSDADELPERYTGMVARYENTRLGTDRVHLRFAFEDYHEQWNAGTAAAAPRDAFETSALYRARDNFEPEVTFTLARPLTLSVGASFEQMQFAAAPNESSNALVTTLRYHRRLEDSDNQHDLDAGYNLRAATKALGSDFVYARHRWEFRYMITRGKSVFIEDVTAGFIGGRAPLYERFTLGNSSTLRGWNKYELDPLGGSRVVHNSVEYRYRVVEIFYDTGAIWDRNQPVVPRHAVGVGLRQGNLSLAVAFPVKEGRIEPIFMVGMNY